ncbi:MAG: ATP-binding cassette domain-containing protein [Ignavibacteria bacterium]|nr:MAG: ATP-binding cassette domain-containing protein [Ignavibacteria bacterium]
MLNVTRVRKTFASVTAVDDVSLNVRRGEILGLLGPNGAGKTTIIRMILNIIPCDAGTISFDGREFSEDTRDIIGYLPEERGLYRKSKVLNTILYFARLKGIEADDAKRRGYKWLERFDLLTSFERRIDELSKGNQQKVQFIISVLHDPQLVILDEPFSGLDPVNQVVLKDTLMELKQQGKAIILSTHQMDQAEKLCDRICLIDRGKVVLDGSISGVRNRYGRNTLHIEFSGDASFIPGLPWVKTAHLYENSAEIELNDHEGVSTILRELAGRLEVTKFETSFPSLNAIFLNLVSGAPGTNAGKEGAG